MFAKDPNVTDKDLVIFNSAIADRVRQIISVLKERIATLASDDIDFSAVDKVVNKAVQFAQFKNGKAQLSKDIKVGRITLTKDFKVKQDGIVLGSFKQDEFYELLIEKIDDIINRLIDEKARVIRDTLKGLYRDLGINKMDLFIGELSQFKADDALSMLWPLAIDGSKDAKAIRKVLAGPLQLNFKIEDSDNGYEIHYSVGNGTYSIVFPPVRSRQVLRYLDRAVKDAIRGTLAESVEDLWRAWRARFK